MNMFKERHSELHSYLKPKMDWELGKRNGLISHRSIPFTSQIAYLDCLIFYRMPDPEFTVSEIKGLVGKYTIILHLSILFTFTSYSCSI